MDTGLRRRRRGRPAANTSSFHHGERDAAERFCPARKSADIHGDGEQCNGYDRELESERHCRIIPANPLALPASPPGVTGVFGAQAVAVDNSTGAVIGATLGGWSCVAPGPAQFDGTYQIAGLPVGSSYTVYTEALNGAADPSQFNNALTSLCRNAMTDAGWPPLQSCIVPAVNISFTTRTRTGP